MPDVPVAGVSPISSPPHEVETESIPQPEMEPREEGELESDDETEAEEEPRPGQGQSDRRAWTSSYRSDYFRKGAQSPFNPIASSSRGRRSEKGHSKSSKLLPAENEASSLSQYDPRGSPRKKNEAPESRPRHGFLDRTSRPMDRRSDDWFNCQAGSGSKMVSRPPPELVDLKVTDLLYLWYVSEGVRDVLGSQQWLEKMRTGKFPVFCMFDNEFCTYYSNQTKLNNHWLKNPAHKSDISALLRKGRQMAEQNTKYDSGPRGKSRSRSPVKRSESNYHKPWTVPGSRHDSTEPYETLTNSELAMTNTCLCRHCGGLFDSHVNLREHREQAQKQGGSCPKLPIRNKNSARQTCFRCKQSMSLEDYTKHKSDLLQYCSRFRTGPRTPSPSVPPERASVSPVSCISASETEVNSAIQEPNVSSSRIRESPSSQSSSSSPPINPLNSPGFAVHFPSSVPVSSPGSIRDEIPAPTTSIASEPTDIAVLAPSTIPLPVPPPAPIHFDRNIPPYPNHVQAIQDRISNPLNEVDNVGRFNVYESPPRLQEESQVDGINGSDGQGALRRLKRPLDLPVPPDCNSVLSQSLEKAHNSKIIASLKNEAKRLKASEGPVLSRDPRRPQIPSLHSPPIVSGTTQQTRRYSFDAIPTIGSRRISGEVASPILEPSQLSKFNMAMPNPLISPIGQNHDIDRDWQAFQSRQLEEPKDTTKTSHRDPRLMAKSNPKESPALIQRPAIELPSPSELFNVPKSNSVPRPSLVNKYKIGRVKRIAPPTEASTSPQVPPKPTTASIPVKHAGSIKDSTPRSSYALPAPLKKSPEKIIGIPSTQVKPQRPKVPESPTLVRPPQASKPGPSCSFEDALAMPDIKKPSAKKSLPSTKDVKKKDSKIHRTKNAQGLTKKPIRKVSRAMEVESEGASVDNEVVSDLAVKPKENLKVIRVRKESSDKSSTCDELPAVAKKVLREPKDKKTKSKSSSKIKRKVSKSALCDDEVPEEPSKSIDGQEDESVCPIQSNPEPGTSKKTETTDSSSLDKENDLDIAPGSGENPDDSNIGINPNTDLRASREETNSKDCHNTDSDLTQGSEKDFSANDNEPADKLIAIDSAKESSCRSKDLVSVEDPKTSDNLINTVRNQTENESHPQPKESLNHSIDKEIVEPVAANEKSQEPLSLGSKDDSVLQKIEIRTEPYVEPKNVPEKNLDTATTETEQENFQSNEIDQIVATDNSDVNASNQDDSSVPEPNDIVKDLDNTPNLDSNANDDTQEPFLLAKNTSIGDREDHDFSTILDQGFRNQKEGDTLSKEKESCSTTTIDKENSGNVPEIGAEIQSTEEVENRMDTTCPTDANNEQSDVSMDIQCQDEVFSESVEMEMDIQRNIEIGIENLETDLGLHCHEEVVGDETPRTGIETPPETQLVFPQETQIEPFLMPKEPIMDPSNGPEPVSETTRVATVCGEESTKSKSSNPNNVTNAKDSPASDFAEQAQVSNTLDQPEPEKHVAGPQSVKRKRGRPRTRPIDMKAKNVRANNPGKRGRKPSKGPLRSLQEALGGEDHEENSSNSVNDQDSAPLVIYKNEVNSIDDCPKCGTKFDPILGRYSMNIMTFEISIKCLICDRYVTIRNAFDVKERSLIR